jgi:PRC-barrel domain
MIAAKPYCSSEAISYGADDRKIGTVQRVMIDKVSGKIAYAMVSFGVFRDGRGVLPMP